MKKNLILAFIGSGIGGIGFGLVSPVTVILLEQNKASSWVTGSVTMIGYLSIVLFSSYAGKLISKINLKKVLIIGLILWTLGALVHVFWYIYPLLYIVKFIMGIGGTFIFVTTEVTVNYYSNEFNRGKYIGLYILFLSVGIAVGTMLIWTIKFGNGVPFLIGSVIMLFVLILQIVLFDEIKTSLNKTITKEFKLNKMPPISLITASLYGLFESSVIVAIPIFGLRNGFSQEEISIFLGSYVIGGIIISYLINQYSDFVSKQSLIKKLVILLGLLFLIPIFTGKISVLLISFFILGGIIPSLYTIGLSHTIDKVESEFISNANGFYIMIYGTGTILGPLAASLFIEIEPKIGYWIFSSIMCFYFAVIFGKLKRE